MLYVSDLLLSSMRKARVLRQGENPSPKELNDAFQVLLVMLHSWSARKLMVRANVEEEFDLVANQASYTIGVGDTFDFNTTKPYQITTAYIKDSNNITSPLDILPKELYDTFADKDVSNGRPEALIYDLGAPQQAVQFGTIIMYFAPEQAYKLGIMSQKPLTDFSKMTDRVTFDPMYEEAIIYEVAVRLWGEYHKTSVPDDLERLAEAAMHVVESANAVTPVAVTDIPGTKNKTGYNIYTGSNYMSK